MSKIIHFPPLKITEEDFEDVEEFSISTSDDELEDYLLDNIDIEDIYIE
mgnify:CR=1 FL=1